MAGNFLVNIFFKLDNCFNRRSVKIKLDPISANAKACDLSRRPATPVIRENFKLDKLNFFHKLFI